MGAAGRTRWSLELNFYLLWDVLRALFDSFSGIEANKSDSSPVRKRSVTRLIVCVACSIEVGMRGALQMMLSNAMYFKNQLLTEIKLWSF